MDNSLVLIAIAIALFTAFLLHYRSTSSHKKHKLQNLPELPGSRPFIGHLHLLSGPNLPHITLGAFADKYGPIFTIRQGRHKAIVVSSSEIAKEMYTKHDRVFASRPRSTAFKHLGYDYAMFGVSPYGPYWRELRKLSSNGLLSNSRLELLRHVWDSEIKMSLKELYEVGFRRNNSEEGTRDVIVVDMKKWFSDLTLNMSVRMFAGKRYFGAANGSHDEEEARACQKGMRDFFKLLGLYVISDSFPFLGWLDLGGHIKEMKRTAKELDVLVQGWLDEHKKKRLKGGIKEGDKDFMDVMLEMLEDAKLLSDFPYDTDTIIKSTCLSLVSGATDTTTVTLVWALSLLLNNQHVLKNAHDELDIHIGKERQVEESDIKNLTYLQAILKETLRLYPAGPLGGPRETTEDCILAGYHVPAGTRLVVNLWKIQRDPMVWSDPMEFKPERFLTTHVNKDVKGQNFELIPFGSGRRSCPGTSLALQVMHLTLARLIHEFEFKSVTGEPVDMTESVGMTNSKATPLEVVLTPRLPT